MFSSPSTLMDSLLLTMSDDSFGLVCDSLSYVEIYLLACVSRSTQERLRLVSPPGSGIHLSTDDMMVDICTCAARNISSTNLLFGLKVQPSVRARLIPSSADAFWKQLLVLAM